MTVKRQNGRIQDFLGYYDKAVSLLRKSLAGGQVYEDATLLTTLQLATFEVSQKDYHVVSIILKRHCSHASGIPWRLRQSLISSTGRSADAVGPLPAGKCHEHGDRTAGK